jgi:Helix-turn-helix domain
MKTRNLNIGPDDRLAFGINEAAAVSGICRNSIYKLLNTGTLPSRKIAGRRLILREDLVAVLHGERR